MDNAALHQVTVVVLRGVSHAATTMASKPASTTNGFSALARSTNLVQGSRLPMPEFSVRDPIFVVQETRLDVIKRGFKPVSTVVGVIKLVRHFISVLIPLLLGIPTPIARHRQLADVEILSIRRIVIRMGWQSVIMANGCLRNVIRRLSVWVFRFRGLAWHASGPRIEYESTSKPRP